MENYKMKNELTNNSIATKKLNSSKNYNKDKNTYFIYYIAGVIVLGVFLNLAVNIKSTDEYYEKYYVLEDYISNYEEEDSDSDGYEEIDDDEDTGSSEEIDESLNEEDNSDTDINEEY